MLLFIDNIFRFVQAGSEVSALLGRMPCAVGYQPTLATEMGELQERITSTKQGLDHLGAGHLRAGRRPHRPGAGDHVRPPGRDDVLSRAISAKGIYPAVDPLASTSRILEPSIVGEEHYEVATRVQQMLQRYKDLQDIIAILGMDELSDEDKLDRAARPQDRALPLAAVHRRRGVHRHARASTSSSRTRSAASSEILDGKHDELPEQAFYMVGAIDDAVEKAAELKAVAPAPSPDEERKRLGVRVLTPEGAVFSGEAEIMVVPGSAGELGILAHHAPLISSLKPGHMTVAEGGERLEWATAGGFIEVRKNEALVLVSEAVRREDIDAGEARARLELARADLERAESGDGDVFRATREATFAEALVDVAEG